MEGGRKSEGVRSGEGDDNGFVKCMHDEQRGKQKRRMNERFTLRDKTKEFDRRKMQKGR